MPSRIIQRHREICQAGVGFTPAQLSAVSSWFRVAQGTITGSGYSSVPDILNAANPAVQATDALRPPAGTSANGLPIITNAAGVLNVPISAATNDATSFGFWAWLKRTTAAGAPAPMGCRAAGGGFSTNKAQMQGVAVADLGASVWDATNAERFGNVVGGYTLNTWVFATFEYDDTQGTEAGKFVLTLGGVPQTVTFSGAGTPAALRSGTGVVSILAPLANGTNPWVGQMGPNFGFFGSKMSGATTGLLTSAARTTLMNFEAPT